MKFQSLEFFRVPTELTQENLPLTFQYFNSVIPLLEKLRGECFRYYIEECSKSTKYVMDLRKQREMSKHKSERRQSKPKNQSCTGSFFTKIQQMFQKFVPKATDPN